MYPRLIKRFLDFCLAFLALLMLLPLILILYIWLHVANKGAGAVVTQERPGTDEKIFKLYKFKSMTDERDASGELLPDAERITAVGRFIRKTSLDELPQLWNVLRGDMSFVGPRPLLVAYLPYYTEVEKLRHTVRPGITGLAQVSGRNFLGWDERLRLDVDYVQNLSLLLDIKILYLTFMSVVRRKDVCIIPGELGKPLNIERSKQNDDI